MDQKIKADWVNALRSGKYKQTDGRLRHGNGYCCLGVLCDAMGAKWLGETPTINNVRLEEVDECLLSGHALNLTGLDQPTQEKLADMNDKGKPFSEIADYIESNL